MTTVPCALAEQRSVLEAAREVLAQVASDTTRLSEAEVAQVMGLVDEVAAQAGTARVGLAVETARRTNLSVRELGGWVAEHAPSLRQGGASAVARVAAEVVGPSRAAGLSGGAPVEPDPSSPVGIVWEHVRHGRLAAGNAVSVLVEEARLHERLVPDAVPTVTEALVDLVVDHGPATMKRLRPRLLAEHGRAGELDTLQERLRSGAYLSTRFVASAELTSYELVMTPEQAATLEAAIGPLSKPQPNEEIKEKDRRPAGQRRVEALTRVCQRSASIDADSAGADGAAGSPSALHVTIGLSDLQQVTGYAEVLGSVAVDTVLGPGQLRRIACDTTLIPYVLGTEGEVIDQGTAVRLYTRAQRRRLWLRDGGCTYPGCTIPATWCRAHHVRHWTDHGPSDLGNAALLCERHHTLVHTRRLWADVQEKPDERGRYVVWDLYDGSYDRALTNIQGCEAREGPPGSSGTDRERPPRSDGTDGERSGTHTTAHAQERRRADAQTLIFDLLRDALAEHDERLAAEWYDRPIDDMLAESAWLDAERFVRPIDDMLAESA
ncbi:MAG: HNH endonuclease signature motif containing protein [Phycicoccus sp.]